MPELTPEQRQELADIGNNFEPEYDPSKEKSVEDWKAEMASEHSALLRQVERGDAMDDGTGLPGNPAPLNQRKAALAILKERREPTWDER